MAEVGIDRCVNVDWLEVYCLEPSQPRDISYFSQCGYFVKDRGYGTRHMASVFTLFDTHGDPFLEVRREPRHEMGEHHAIYPDNACTLRLVNRYCYFDRACEIMQMFIVAHGYELRRIARLDLCLDFERFDSGDLPAKVIRRILTHKYAKVYQAKRTTRGEDRWDGCSDNYVAWGNPKSMVMTAFYNKSKELREVHDKPWIRQAWLESGLIDDTATMTRVNAKGECYSPEIWRLEFRIKSSARQWYVTDPDSERESVPHTLECYYTRVDIMHAVEFLISHYFRFKVYQEGVRKYDCPEKVLFKFHECDRHYKLVNTSVERVYNSKLNGHLRMIACLRGATSDVDCLRALDLLDAYFKSHEIQNHSLDAESVKVLQLRLMYADMIRRAKARLAREARGEATE